MKRIVWSALFGLVTSESAYGRGLNNFTCNAKDMTKLYLYAAITLLALLLAALAVFYIYRLKRRLSQSLDSLHEANVKLVRQAHYDALTDIPNRILFSACLDQSLRLATRNQTKLGLLLIDLDDFKSINNHHGHSTGDLVLQEVARRIHRSIRDSDTVGRIGGDEFFVLLAVVDGVEAAANVAEKIRTALGEPIHVEGLNLQVSSSIGVALYPKHGTDEVTLAKNADIAMYQAKENGRNNVQVYGSDAS